MSNTPPETPPDSGASKAEGSPDSERRAETLPEGVEPRPVGRRRRRRRRGGRGPGSESGPIEGAPEGSPDGVHAHPPRPPRRERDRGGDEERLPDVRDDGERQPPTAAAVRDDGAPADIPPERLDVEGLKILNRLHRFNHEAYFVGGCVRDLLLDRAPKDFDIATSAHPGEVRSLFRNCRLIGRRFRLAHIYFRGGKIIEVSTFRANPTEADQAAAAEAAEAAGEEPQAPDDLLITRDNVFGTAEQDARRRDFTVNGLFYDIRKGRVIDYVDGLRDHRARLIRTIGDPEVRLREDPVRILRAVRFAAKLDFDIDPATYAAMEGAVEDLPRCAPARLLEEVFRLLRSGYSKKCFELLYALGALHILLPPLHDYLRQASPAARDEIFARLGEIDRRQLASPLDDALIVAALFTPMARGKAPEGDEDSTEPAPIVGELLHEMVQSARLPRRVADKVKALLWAQDVLTGQRKRRRSLASFRRHPIYPEAVQLLEVGVAATGQFADALERWRSGNLHPHQLGNHANHAPPKNGEGGGPPGEGGVRRRRRRRRGGRGRSGEGEGGGGEGPAGGGAPPSEG